MKQLRLAGMLALAAAAFLSIAGIAGAQTPSPSPSPDAPTTGRPFLGVRLDQTNDGVVIAEVLEGSPAAEAELEVGDVITAVNGEPVEQARDVVMQIGRLAVGDEVTLEVSRDNEPLTVDVTLGSAPADGRGPRGPGMGQGGRPQGPFDMQVMPLGLMNGRLGIAFETLTPEIASDMNVDVTDGAVVREVQEDTPASEAGLQVGDIITAVNDEPVDAERTLRDRLIAYETGDTVSLLVLRDGETLTVEVTLAEPLMPSELPNIIIPMPGGPGRPGHSGTPAAPVVPTGTPTPAQGASL